MIDDTPEVFFYVCDDEAIPEQHKWMGVYYRKGKPLPMVFRGRTAAEVADIATKWWAQERGKADRANQIAAERAERLRKAKRAARYQQSTDQRKGSEL